MSWQQPLDPTLALGHALCLEIVGHSSLAHERQQQLAEKLNGILAHHSEGAAAESHQISGDGTVSVVFLHDPKEPLRCAIEIAEQIPDALRMGIHTGSLQSLAKGDDQLVDAVVEDARRIMECGDAGNILVSEISAAVLLSSREFQGKLEEFGEAELEPGRVVQLFSYNDQGASPETATKVEAELPTVIDGRYRLLEKLGQGGMGRVYMALDTRLDRHVALKLLTPHHDNEHYRSRFYHEARAASRLNHPHIATIHDYGTTSDNHQYIVMELVRGETLSKVLNRGPLRIEQTIQIVAQVAEALGEAHRRGVVHRDIKPGNVAIDEAGKVKVLDFGLSKQMPTVDSDVPSNAEGPQSGLSQSGVILGTPLYLSPEQAKGVTVDARSDIFSVGSMLYECLTGHAPFAGGSILEICSNVIHLQPQAPSKLNPNVPTELDQINLKALAKEPDGRYQSADELRDQLLAVQSLRHELGTASTKVYPAPSKTPTWRDRVKRPEYWIPIAAAVLLLGSVGLWATRNRRTADTSQQSAAQTWYVRGTQSLRDGAYFAARKTLEQAVKDNPRFALAHARLAEAYMELDVTDLAAQEMLRAEDGRQDLSEVDGLRLSAIKATVQRDFPTAVQTYQTLQQRLGTQENIDVDLGRAYERNNQTDKAIQSFERATQINSEDAAAFVHLGKLYGRRHEADKALAAFTRAEALYELTSNTEGRAEVLFQRGFYFYVVSKYQEAKANLDKAFSVASENTNQQVRILMPLSNVYCFSGEPEKALKTSENAVAMARANAMNVLTAQALVGLGSAHQCAGHNAEAEKYVAEGLSLARRYDARTTEARALLTLGSVQVQAGKTDEGLQNVQSALALYEKLGGDSDDPLSGQAILGRGLQQKGDYPGALKAFGDLLSRVDPSDYDRAAFAHEGLGTVKLLQEKYPEALAEYQLSLRANQAKEDRLGEGFAYSNLGNALWRLGRYDEARKMFDQALGNGSGPSGYENLQQEVQTNELEQALSRRDFPMAARTAGQILSLKNLDPGAGVRAKRALALVALNAGKAAEAKKLCDEAIAKAVDLGDPALLYSARSTLAQVLLETQDAASALKTITEDLNHLVSKDQQESLWQAYLFAARASEKLGDTDSALKYAAQSREVLASIHNTWGEQAYQLYIKRPDVNSMLGQLNKLPA